jgi:hypothetical protein
MKDTSKAKFQCPYCGSPFDDKEALSKHINRLHEETGILEGELSKDGALTIHESSAR